MKTFKEFKSSILSESESGLVPLEKDDIVFDVDNVDIEDVITPDEFDNDDDAEDMEEAVSVADTIKSIVKDKGANTVKFADGKTLKVDLQTANVLLKIADALNNTNKDKFFGMLNKDKASFMKMVDFAWKQVG